MPGPTKAEVIKLMRKHLEGQFPRQCGSCQRRFFTLREYLLTTNPLGSVTSYDLDAGNWEPTKPLGTFIFSNCACRNTLSLNFQEMRLSQLWSVFRWIKTEAQEKGKTPQELLNHLREEIWKQVLAGRED